MVMVSMFLILAAFHDRRKRMLFGNALHKEELLKGRGS